MLKWNSFGVQKKKYNGFAITDADALNMVLTFW